MIGSVSHKIGKTTHKLKFSTRALLRLEEEHDGRAFNSILEDIITGNGGVSLVAAVLAAIMDDGQGVDREVALDVIDEAGGFRKVVPALSKAMNVAFPEIKQAFDAARAAAAKAEDAGEGKAQAPASA